MTIETAGIAFKTVENVAMGSLDRMRGEAGFKFEQHGLDLGKLANAASAALSSGIRMAEEKVAGIALPEGGLKDVLDKTPLSDVLKNVMTNHKGDPSMPTAGVQPQQQDGLFKG